MRDWRNSLLKEKKKQINFFSDCKKVHEKERFQARPGSVLLRGASGDACLVRPGNRQQQECVAILSVMGNNKTVDFEQHIS